MSQTSFGLEIESNRTPLMKRAMRLCRRKADAEDLVQTTMMKALCNRDRFTPGTNLQAWLMTILNNIHFTDCRRNGRMVEDPNGLIAGHLIASDNPETACEARQMLGLISRLPDVIRQTFILAIGGNEHHETAEAEGVAIGTIKSRVHRGRAHLERMMGVA
ncbi:MAG: sigma-70 family RNA polymerase sigma factor [Mesorhizobium sp.]|uniref:sigma-70 family RNA polymerase sigma factor n=1 Tax=Mesorhizobium sp. TaxID=1871066 RepID=UPI000FE6ECB2|nr:sigma-70 family RNA polymerase sigma factor [Mesorhizobium sp.]RWF44273.1 MAG: sigma-70 family RNA polymerase sigma factor [Mesorhizobium sp.]